MTLAPFVSTTQASSRRLVGVQKEATEPGCVPGVCTGVSTCVCMCVVCAHMCVCVCGACTRVYV